LVSGSSNATTVQDTIRLNEALGQKERNLSLFDQLPQESPCRAMLLDSVLDQLLSARRYEEILKGADANAVFAQEVARMEQMLASLGNNATMKARVEGVFRQNAVSKGSHYFEALAGVHKDEEAKTLADQIFKFDSTATTKDKLLQGAKRAGDADLAKYIRSK
jgi:hypothetical protein